MRSCHRVVREQSHSEQKKHKVDVQQRKLYQRNVCRLKLSKKPVVQHSKLNPSLLSLNYSTAAQTPAGCHSHRSPAGGAGIACLHGDPDPWPSHSPGSAWDRGSQPPRWGSGKSCCSAPGKTWIQVIRDALVWDFVPWLLTAKLKYT